MNPIVQAIFTGVLEGNAELVRQKVPEALATGVAPATILNKGMIAAMAEVGRLFEAGEYFVPEMLIAARAMKTGTEILKPHQARVGALPAQDHVGINFQIPVTQNGHDKSRWSDHRTES